MRNANVNPKFVRELKKTLAGDFKVSSKNGVLKIYNLIEQYELSESEIHILLQEIK